MPRLTRIALVLLTALPMTACDLQDVMDAANADGPAAIVSNPRPSLPPPRPRPITPVDPGAADQSVPQGPGSFHDGERPPGPASGPQTYTQN